MYEILSAFLADYVAIPITQDLATPAMQATHALHKKHHLTDCELPYKQRGLRCPPLWLGLFWYSAQQSAAQHNAILKGICVPAMRNCVRGLGVGSQPMAFGKKFYYFPNNNADYGVWTTKQNQHAHLAHHISQETLKDTQHWQKFIDGHYSVVDAVVALSGTFEWIHGNEKLGKFNWKNKMCKYCISTYCERTP